MLHGSPPVTGRLISFRLTDVPADLRRRFGRTLVRHATEDCRLEEAVAFTRAIEHPSDRVYRVSAEAWQRVIESRL